MKAMQGIFGAQRCLVEYLAGNFLEHIILNSYSPEDDSGPPARWRYEAHFQWGIFDVVKVLPSRSLLLSSQKICFHLVNEVDFIATEGRTTTSFEK